MRPVDPGDALAALERLLRHDVISPDEARLAARVITGNDALEFPPPPATPAESDASGAPPHEPASPPS